MRCKHCERRAGDSVREHTKNAWKPIKMAHIMTAFRVNGNAKFFLSWYDSCICVLTRLEESIFKSSSIASERILHMRGKSQNTYAININSVSCTTFICDHRGWESHRFSNTNWMVGLAGHLRCHLHSAHGTPFSNKLFSSICGALCEFRNAKENECVYRICFPSLWTLKKIILSKTWTSLIMVQWQ